MEGLSVEMPEAAASYSICRQRVALTKGPSDY